LLPCIVWLRWPPSWKNKLHQGMLFQLSFKAVGPYIKRTRSKTKRPHPTVRPTPTAFHGYPWLCRRDANSDRRAAQAYFPGRMNPHMVPTGYYMLLIAPFCVFFTHTHIYIHINHHISIYHTSISFI
jgi:hypothetical protein